MQVWEPVARQQGWLDTDCNSVIQGTTKEPAAGEWREMVLRWEDWKTKWPTAAYLHFDLDAGRQQALAASAHVHGLAPTLVDIAAADTPLPRAGLVVFVLPLSSGSGGSTAIDQVALDKLQRRLRQKGYSPQPGGWRGQRVAVYIEAAGHASQETSDNVDMTAKRA